MRPELTEMNFTNKHSTGNGIEIENQNDSNLDDELYVFRDDDDDDDCNNVKGGTLNQQDLLHGYVPDNGYNPSGLEEEGVYPETLTWTYGEVPENRIN
ncbi:hypothetical protein HJC23_008884 [Cyclotella cryptica]|uniref:Uncharacterized protein n=1 Tax=Cyclotella cryptica TaxID=29204 RepID=A0ABD3PAV6_9STRA